MKTIQHMITTDSNLQIVARLAADLGVTAYLVGGGLRDCLLNRSVKDLDFVLGASADVLPGAFAEKIGATCFWLDEERLQSRVMKRIDDRHLTFDFAPLRGASIEDDLALRDFTINALAYPLDQVRQLIIDPLGGRSDLVQRVVRACTERSFDDDPLRILRAFRFSATLGFRMDEHTLCMIRQRPHLLMAVAGERIRDEFLKILELPRSVPTLADIWREGLFSIFLPMIPPPTTSLAELEEFEQLCCTLDDIFPDAAAWIREVLGREVEGGVSLLILVKLALLVRGEQPKNQIREISEQLHLGRKATNVLGFLQASYKAGFKELSEQPTHRVMYRFFRDREPAGTALLLMAMARGELSQEVCSNLFRYGRNEYVPAESRLFLSGGEVMTLLDISHGPQVGEVMESLRVAESTGIVTTADEARSYVKNLLTKE